MKKKWIMPSRESLQSAYPTDPDAARMAARATVSSLPEHEKEQPVMKKKMSLAFVLLCVFLAIACVAIAATTDVFGLFADSKTQHAGMGHMLSTLDEKSQSVGDEREIASSEDGHYKRTTFTLEQTYYDGESLFLSYSLRDAKNIVSDWQPTEDDLKLLDMTEVYIGGVSQGEDTAEYGMMLDDESLKQTLIERAAKGAGGVIVYNTYISDGVYISGTDDYLDLSMSDDMTLEDGTLIGYKRFESPLPEAARGKDSFSVDFKVYRAPSYLYFDGAKWYQGSKGRTEEIISTVIERNADETSEIYPFTASAGDHVITGALTITAIDVKLSYTFADVTGTQRDEGADGSFAHFLVYADGARLSPILGEESGDTQVSALMTFALPQTAAKEFTLIPLLFDSTNTERGDREMTEDAVVIRTAR